ISKLIEENGTAFVARGHFRNLHIFADPRLVERVLFEKHANYVRPPNKIVDTLLRDSAMILPEDQEQWREERFSVLNSLLGKRNVTKHAEIMIDTVESQLNTWEKWADGKQEVNFHEIISAITIRNLCNLLFDRVEIDDIHLAHLIREYFYVFVA